MKQNREMVLRRITSFVLLFAMVAGMTAGFARKTNAAGGWKVTITYYNGEANKSYTCPTNSTLKLPTPTKTVSGATFLGWKCGSAVYSAGQIITVKSNMSIVGVWSYYVAFYSNGYLFANLQQKTGYQYNVPKVPTKTGYVFVKWVDANGKIIDNNTTVQSIDKRNITAQFRITPSAASAKIDKVLYGAYDPDGIMKDTAESNKIRPTASDANYGYVRQCSRPDYGDHVQGEYVGLCVYCAFTNLLNRRSVLDRNRCAFMLEANVFSKMYPAADNENGNFGRTSSGNYYIYKGAGKTKEGSAINENGIATKEIEFKGTDGVKYTLKRVKFSNGVSRDTLKSYIDQHPEGVVIYSGGHACVVTGYTSSSFYCVDTGSHTGDRWKSTGQTLGAVYITDKYIGSATAKEDACLRATTQIWYVK